MSQSNAMDKVTEIWSNSTAPYNPMATSSGGGSLVAGNVQVIATEVAVSTLIRWLMRWAKKPIFELVAVHTVSQSMLGGFSGFFNQNKYLDAKPGVTVAAMDAAKGVPGLLAAQYVINTANRGLHLPIISFKDILITGASKVISRPLIAFLYPNVGKTLQRNFRAHDEMVAKQRTVARFKS